jgi:hypothetical protein
MLFEFSPYLKENTVLHHYKDWIILFKEIIAVYSENHAKPINTKYKLTDSYHSALNG